MENGWKDITKKRFDLDGSEQHLIFWSKSYTVWEYAEINPDTLCQYTGLTDKNDKKIWENDIVKNKKRTEGFDWYKVVWRKDFADFGVEPIKPQFEAKYPMGLSDELTIYGRDYEVIGNVFDNPEMLEVE